MSKLGIGLTDPLNYSMNNNSLALMIEPKMVYTQYRIQPYIFGGIGCAWNTLSDYTETQGAYGNAAPNTTPYANNTQAEFAYEAGLGVQYALWKGAGESSVLLRAEYRYMNLGQSELSSQPGQTTPDRIAVNSATNIVDIGMTYQFK